MKLEYKILWIDNELQEYIDNGDVKDVENFLLEKGFEPIIEPVFDEDDVAERLAKHEYDLILSDYNLNKSTGVEIIEFIRVTKQLDTEILFYTGQGSYKDNPEVQRKLAFIERVTFQIGRDTLIEKIERVILLTIKKLLELNATRGIVTAATSELDVDMQEIVMLLINKYHIGEAHLKEIITNKVYNPLEKRHKNFWEAFENFQSYYHQIDAVKKWEIFRDLLKPLKSDETIAAFLKTNGTYQTDVIDVRNKFAHAKEQVSDGKKYLKGQFGKEDFHFDEDACYDVRKKLINHRKELQKLKIHLTGLI